MGDGVDAIGQATYYEWVDCREVVYQSGCGSAAVVGGFARAYNGDAVLGVEVALAEAEEEDGVVLAPLAVQSLGIGGVGEEKGLDAILLHFGSNLLGLVHSRFVLNGLYDAMMAGEELGELGV